MTRTRLILRSLGYYWRQHLGVLIGTAIATAVLVGALAVGDSVRFTLRRIALDRLGQVHAAVAPQGRFFRTDLAASISAESASPVAAVIQLEGLIRRSARGAETTGPGSPCQVYGVDEAFWKLSPSGRAPADDWAEGVVLNRRLAESLDLRVGQTVLLLAAKPSALPRDAPLASGEDLVARLGQRRVTAIADEAHFGRFSLRANQVAPMACYLPRSVLAEQAEQEGLANLLLIGGPGVRDEATARDRAAQAQQVLSRSWQLADVGVQLRRLDDGRWSLRSRRIFLDPPMVQAARAIDPDATPVLTYFVTSLIHGERTTPYSTVAAIAPPASARPDPPETARQLLPVGMPDDQIVINQWLADDLQAGPDDTITLRYYELGSSRKLVEKDRSFTVARVVAMSPPALDRALMPDFPGLADAETSQDWEPGIDINRRRIRQKDDAYWDNYRGTPKAFVTLSAGRQMWSNRYGNATAVRFSPGRDSQQLARRIRERIDPGAVGLVVLPVRADALAAVGESLDFGQLFIGFSFFLILSAVLLTALLFIFGIQQRSGQVGTLLAMGFRPGQLRRLLTAEGAVVAVFGAIVGAPAGLAYTRAMLWGLATAWSQAVPSSRIAFHATAATVLIGSAVAVVVAVAAMWLTLLRLSRRSVRRLHASSAATVGSAGRSGRWPGWVGAVLTVGAVVRVLSTGQLQGTQAAMAFFGLGAAMLVGTILLCYAGLTRLAGVGSGRMSLAGLGLRSTARRRGRSVAALALLACGAFLVVAVAANRQDPLDGTDKASSGTGGFTWYAELSTPVVHDLNSRAGQVAAALSPDVLAGVEIAQLRLRPGDDASCMNLNRAQRPRLLGVDPAAFDRRGAFTFTQNPAGEQAASPWSAALAASTPVDVIPAVGDEATVVWGLGLSVGDEVEYVDEFGREYKVRIVGTIKNSIFQGALLVSEDAFLSRYPSTSGYLLLLIDAGPDRREQVAEELRFGLGDQGLVLNSAPRRLAGFTQVEQAYLSIFGVVGGLGLLLGSCAMGVVVLRNILERRGELGLMRAVGFSRARLRWMVLAEHWALLGLGLACGVVSGLVAVLPALRSPGAEVPVETLAWVLAGVVLSGGLWVLLASVAGLRGRLLEAVRRE